MSELKTIERLLNKMETEHLEVYQVHTGGAGVNLEFVQWNTEGDEPQPDFYNGYYRLPDSVPMAFFERAGQSDKDKVSYLSVMAGAFMRGASDVLHIAENAMAKESVEKVVDRWVQATKKIKANQTNAKPKTKE